ncbi:MAG: DUF488 domain-containing protein [Pirellulaceae bacterium]
MTRPLLFTIGHSDRSLADFIELLKMFDVSAVADVRSHPFSRWLPYFNGPNIKSSLRETGIAYAFLGRELGARRTESSCYLNGKVNYDLIERTPAFQSGINRIRKGVKSHRIALMCSEWDPATCHRTILISKALRSELEIHHILSNEAIESHEEVEQRLLLQWQVNERNLFLSELERLNDAYSRQAAEIAYTLSDAPLTLESARQAHD